MPSFARQARHLSSSSEKTEVIRSMKPVTGSIRPSGSMCTPSTMAGMGGMRSYNEDASVTQEKPGTTVDSLIPVEIRVLRRERCLLLSYRDGRLVSLPAELLRVKSPSSENKRLDQQGNLKVIGGRRYVSIMKVEPVGHYGIRVFFDDLHDSGIFGYSMLDDLARTKFSTAKEYLRELKLRGLSRDPAVRHRTEKQ